MTNIMRPLPIRGLLAPAFLALGIAAGIIDLRVGSRSLGWLSLLSLALGLTLSGDMRRLLSRAGGDK